MLGQRLVLRESIKERKCYLDGQASRQVFSASRGHGSSFGVSDECHKAPGHSVGRGGWRLGWGRRKRGANFIWAMKDEQDFKGVKGREKEVMGKAREE